MNKGVFSRNNWLVLIMFGLVGQIAWSVENMYFNLFVYDTIAPDLDTVTLMVQLSGIMATVATLVAGVISDKVGNRRRFISWGYAIWGVTVALFGCLSPSLIDRLFNTGADRAICPIAPKRSSINQLRRESVLCLFIGIPPLFLLPKVL